MNCFRKVIDNIWFLAVLVSSFSIGTVKGMYLPEFSPKQVNLILNPSANSHDEMIKR